MLLHNDLVFGLSWRSGADGKRKAFSAQKREGGKPASYVQIVDRDGLPFYGFSTQPIKSKTTRSFAGLVASSALYNKVGSAAFVFQIDGDTFGLVCTANGAVVTGFDVVADRDTCLDIMSDFVTVASTQGPVSIFSNDTQGAIPFSIEDFLKEDVAQPRVSDCLFQQITPPQVVFGGIAAVVAVVLVAQFSYGAYKDHKIAEERRLAEEAAAAAEMARTQPDAIYRSAVQNFIVSSGSSLDASAIWQKYSSAPPMYKTWTRVKVACDPTLCTETFQPTVKGVEQWKDWADFKEKTEFIIDEGKVLVSVEAPVLAKPKTDDIDQSLQFFGTNQTFFAWVDIVKNLRVGAVKVGKKTLFPSIPITEGRPAVSYFDVEYKGPIWTAGAPHNVNGFMVTGVELQHSPDKQINDPKVMVSEEKASFLIKGVFYVKE